MASAIQIIFFGWHKQLNKQLKVNKRVRPQKCTESYNNSNINNNDHLL